MGEVELDPLEDKFAVAEEVDGEVEVDEESHFQSPEKVTSYYGGYISISRGNSNYNPPSYNWVFKITLPYSCDVS